MKALFRCLICFHMWFPIFRRQVCVRVFVCSCCTLCPSLTWWKCTFHVFLPCLGGCFLVLGVVVFCSVFREATWPSSSLFILTLFKLALHSPSWVFLLLSILSSLSKVPVSCSSHRLPLCLFYPKCGAVAFGVTVSLAFDRSGWQCVTMEDWAVSAFCLVSLSRFLSLSPLFASLFPHFSRSVSKLNIS